MTPVTTLKLKDDGGSAFPYTPTDKGGQYAPCQTGMSLRDYYAGQAITGFLASFAGVDCRMPTPEALAKDAYDQSDAMIAEREKRMKGDTK